MLKRVKQAVWLVAAGLLFAPASVFGATFFQETFDDANFTARGWYDGSKGTIAASGNIPDSKGSFECRFLKGGSGCSGGAPRRHLFTASDRVYVSFWIKHSSNWVGSGKPYHPHMFYLLTNLNGSYDGLAYDRLTAYIEESQGYPMMSLQDGQNIDEARIGVNLVNVTENRSVAGCNGTPPGMGHYLADCYRSGTVHWNATQWRGATPFFFDTALKTKWHFIEAYFQLNTISNGIGQPNGIMRYWYDGKPVIDQNNIIMRTGRHGTMLFNQFVIAPYIGDGSPVEQSFWIDELTVGSSRPVSQKRPSPPTRVVAQ